MENGHLIKWFILDISNVWCVFFALYFLSRSRHLAIDAVFDRVSDHIHPFLYHYAFDIWWCIHEIFICDFFPCRFMFWIGESHVHGTVSTNTHISEFPANCWWSFYLARVPFQMFAFFFSSSLERRNHHSLTQTHIHNTRPSIWYRLNFVSLLFIFVLIFICLLL